MTKNKKRSRALIAAGCLLVCCAVGLTAFNLISGYIADRFAAQTVSQLQEIIPQRGDDAEPAPETQSVTLDGGTYIGIISIPAIDISLPVNSSWSYPLLKKAPCCYQGSAQSGDFIIAGHNYQRHFGKLKQLDAGDEVIFTDVDGYVYKYKVVDVETLDGYDIEDMKSGDWDLTLFTCTYGGISRVTVRCTLES